MLPPREREGLTELELSRLPDRMPLKNTMEENWYLIFSIVFPRQPRPKSPYIEAPLTETINSFREYFASDGHALILRHIRLEVDEISTAREEETSAMFQAILEDAVVEFVRMNEEQSSAPDDVSISSRSTRILQTESNTTATTAVAASSFSSVNALEPSVEQRSHALQENPEQQPGFDSFEGGSSDSDTSSFPRRTSFVNFQVITPSVLVEADAGPIYIPGTDLNPLWYLDGSMIDESLLDMSSAAKPPCLPQKSDSSLKD
jgi:hypothetical protein